MALTKEDIRLSIENQAGVSEFESSRILESVLETVKTTLANGKDVLISGFGKFSVKGKAARRAWNFKSGEHLTLEPHRVVTFKCSPRLKGRLNGKG
jgi:integration host factor subunit alpha